MTMTPEQLAAAVEGRVVGQYLLDNIAEAGERVALRWAVGDEFEEWTWNQVFDRTARVAGAFRAWGLEPGDSVALFLRNRPEFHIADLAAMLCRAKAVSIYNSSAPEQIEYLLGHMEARIVVCDDAEMLGRVLKVRNNLPRLAHLVVCANEVPSDATGWSSLLDAAPLDIAAAVAASKSDDLITLIYTSGTTGRPKGVMIDHANVMAAGHSAQQRLRGEDAKGLDVVSYLPMAHIAERMVSHYGWLRQKHIVTTCPDPTALLSYLKRVRPQLLFGPPRVFEKLRSGIMAAVAAKGEAAKAQFEQALKLGIKAAQTRATDEELPAPLAAAYAQTDAAAFAPLRAAVGLDRMQVAFTGAAPLPTHVFDFMRGIGVPFSEVYGMSENTGGMTWEHYNVRRGRVGKAVAGVEVKLADDDEVLCRGPIVARGYYKDPERTAETFRDGWLHSGDIGRLDVDGYLAIVDRKKELIITAGGKNISPANIEAQLKSHPLIGQACVIGDDRPYITALLLLDPDVAPTWASARGITDTSLASLAAHPTVLEEIERGVIQTNDHFARVEQIKKWLLLSDEWLPDSPQLTATMKLKRRGVHAAYTDQIESMYA